MRTKEIYSFKSEISWGTGEMVDHSKTLISPPGMFTSLEEIQAYIEECEQKKKSNYEWKVLFNQVQIRLHQTSHKWAVGHCQIG